MSLFKKNRLGKRLCAVSFVLIQQWLSEERNRQAVVLGHDVAAMGSHVDRIRLQLTALVAAVACEHVVGQVVSTMQAISDSSRRLRRGSGPSASRKSTQVCGIWMWRRGCHLRTRVPTRVVTH